MTAYEWVIFGVFCALLYWLVIIPLVSLSNRQRTKVERELDDMEQTAAVSRPAPLRPHVKAGTAWGETL